MQTKFAMIKCRIQTSCVQLGKVVGSFFLLIIRLVLQSIALEFFLTGKFTYGNVWWLMGSKPPDFPTKILASVGIGILQLLYGHWTAIWECRQKNK